MSLNVHSNYNVNFNTMLSNILNLNGVTVLDKKQQKVIIGGGEFCTITTIDSNGGRHFDVISSNSVNPSDDGNSFCVSQIDIGNASRCFYDCSHDGPG